MSRIKPTAPATKKFRARVRQLQEAGRLGYIAHSKSTKVARPLDRYIRSLVSQFRGTKLLSAAVKEWFYGLSESDKQRLVSQGARNLMGHHKKLRVIREAKHLADIEARDKEQEKLHGNQKGSAFERKVAGLFIAAAGVRYSKKDCFRTPMSGGHFALQGADLQCSKRFAKVLPFLTECKDRKNIRFEHLFCMIGDFPDFHDQVLAYCKVDKRAKPPLLVFHGRRNTGTYACARKEDLKEYSNGYYARYTFLQYQYKGTEWIAMTLRDFCRFVKRKAKLVESEREKRNG